MIYALPFIAALIGWLTNYVAIKMLFYPKKAVKIGPLILQGVFPKRQKKLAEKLGKIVSEELISIKDLKEAFSESGHSKEIEYLLEYKVEIFLKERLLTKMPMLKMFINDDSVEKIKVVLIEEIISTIPQVIEIYAQKLEEDVNIEQVVYNRVANFSVDKLEDILFSLMQKEFKFIEIVGAVLGFIIGIIQVLLLWIDGSL